MDLLNKPCIFCLICSLLAKGFVIPVISEEFDIDFETTTYPTVGDFVKSSTIDEIIRSSEYLIFVGVPVIL